MFYNVSKVCDRCSSFASFSEDELHLQAQNFGDLHRHFCVAGTAGTALETCRVAYFGNRIFRAASSADNVQIVGQA